MSEPQEPPNGHTNGTPKSASGWDGKLRVNKQATLANPEALEDTDYSDEDAPPVEQIDADEDLLEGEDPEVEVCSRHLFGSDDLLTHHPGNRTPPLQDHIHTCTPSRTIQESQTTMSTTKSDPTHRATRYLQNYFRRA